MNHYDYQFVFDDIMDQFSEVKLYCLDNSEPVSFCVSIGDSQVCLPSGKQLCSVNADLLDLATAIHFADKLALPKKTRHIRIEIILPLRNPEVFTKVTEKLKNLLFWYTSDHWSFKFITRHSRGRLSELGLNQEKISKLPEETEIALWSGGLDSLAGLQNRLLSQFNSHFLLVGTGSNSIMQKTQQQVFRCLNTFPYASGHLSLLRVPLKAKYDKRYSKNRLHRTRGLVFLLIGAVCALVSGSDKLHVYETGIGAINLPYPGGIGRDHSKAVHPISLLNVGKFVSTIMNDEFQIENPFLFSTKAEMCCSLAENPLPIFETISCDRLHREKHIQCGFCSSCILRKQALDAAGIRDETQYLIPHGRNAESRHQIYWKKMNQQIDVLNKAIQSDNPWLRLCLQYSANLPDIVSHLAEETNCDEYTFEKKLVRLYRTYVREWRSVGYSIFEKMTEKINRSEEERWRQMPLIKSIPAN